MHLLSSAPAHGLTRGHSARPRHFLRLAGFNAVEIKLGEHNLSLENKVENVYRVLTLHVGKISDTACIS